MKSQPRSDWWPGRRITTRIIPALAAGCTVALIVSACGGGSTSNAGAGTGHASPVATESTVGPSPSADPAPQGTSGSASAAPSATEDVSPSGSAASPTGATQFLANLDQVAGSGDTDTGSAEVNGQTYANSVYLEVNPGPSDVSYNLGRQWNHLLVTLGLSDNSPENEEIQFQILADQRTIYNHVFALGQSQLVNLNVTGVLRLELIATEVSSYVGQTEAVWGNAELTQ
jgi:hypothetical protein